MEQPWITDPETSSRPFLFQDYIFSEQPDLPDLNELNAFLLRPIKERCPWKIQQALGFLSRIVIVGEVRNESGGILTPQTVLPHLPRLCASDQIMALKIW